MNVLLSIKPEFAGAILEGEKQYESRKSGFKDADAIDIVYLYSSSEVRRIVGVFVMGKVIEDDPETLWEQFGSESGPMTKEQLFSYFDDHETGYAIEVNEPMRLKREVDPRVHLDEFTPPVTFHYVNDELDPMLEEQLPDPIRESQATTLSDYS
jgi:type I restriction enzyme S subunit